MLLNVRQLLEVYPPLEGHSRRVAAVAGAVGGRMGLPAPEVLAVAGYCHDLGKSTWCREAHAAVTLTDADWATIKAHPIIGVAILNTIWPAAPMLIRTVVRGHHERPGGGGYPDGLRTPGIHTLVLAACDVFDALTNPREYRPGVVLTPADALAEVARFAPAAVVQALIDVLNKAEGGFDRGTKKFGC